MPRTIQAEEVGQVMPLLVTRAASEARWAGSMEKGGGLWFLNPTVEIPFVCILRLGCWAKQEQGKEKGSRGEGSQPQVAHRHRVLDLKRKVIWIVAAHRLCGMPIIAIAVRIVSVIIITRTRYREWEGDG